MQYQQNNNLPVIYQGLETSETVSTSAPFIGANTEPTSLAEINHRHIIPVFIKDNEPVISHGEFVGAAMNAVQEMYHGETINSPSVRVSHPIKGRVPEARNKPAKDLLENEKTLYYERMAFIIEVPTIHTDIAGNRLNLTIGGVKAYNLENLNARSGTDQLFKVFVGFQNKVCTNLCVSTDGYMASLKVKNIDMLYKSIQWMLESFEPHKFSRQLETLQNYSLREQQFANLIGRCRMHKYLPDDQRIHVPELLLGDGQINTVCKDYYSDNNFCTDANGEINLWNLYNLFTGANKSSYIDTFLDRSVNALQVSKDLQGALDGQHQSWFLK